jgi:hypothetical protein
LVGRGGGLGRSGRTIESTGAGEERRRGRLLLSGLLCVLVLCLRRDGSAGPPFIGGLGGLILGSARHVEELPTCVHATEADGLAVISRRLERRRTRRAASSFRSLNASGFATRTFAC